MSDSHDSTALPEDDGADAAADSATIDGLAHEVGAGEDFPIVGVGASAGGLRAFQEFFDALPAQPGMAFVLVQHLSPTHETALVELIQARTPMVVSQATDGARVEINQVYVIPPGVHLEIEEERLRLVKGARETRRLTVVDRFFRSLARDMGERAACAVLSGTGSDGALGLEAVKERMGLTLAQTPGDAEHPEMPESAIATGLVDVQGTATELAHKLSEIRDSAAVIDFPAAPQKGLIESDHQALQTILASLRLHTGHDFSQYKRATLFRRLARRLQVTGCASLSAYAATLSGQPEEVRALLRDFLISVTQFFRDPVSYDSLRRAVIPSLFEDKGRADQVRVWVAGCATGEEAYSLTALLCEYQATLDDPPDIQVFATDIDEDALAHAREGWYARGVAADIPPPILRRYFDIETGGVRVRPILRQNVLFAHHNLISDPPFSRLDLVSCRNLLIYLNRDVQARVFAMFHYTLNPDGYLFLGSTEGPGALMKGFSDVDETSRIYRRVEPGHGSGAMPAFRVQTGSRGIVPPRRRSAPPSPGGLIERYQAWTLSQYAPPRVLVDRNDNITHIFGNAGQFLREREGPVTLNAVDKVLRIFRIDLRAALSRAFNTGEPTDTRFQRIDAGGVERAVRLHVGMVEGDVLQDDLAEVVFIELDAASVEALGGGVVDGEQGETEDPLVARLEDELRQVRAQLQATVEESETSTEELKASNEELQSINEELQSTSEELETSKEELQAANEELKSVNQELKDNVEELVRSNSDLQNLIASTDIGTLFLDRDLRIKRFTPRAAELFHVIPSDLGRPLEHLTHRLAYNGFAEDARRVLETLVSYEHTVRRDDDQWYTVRTTPYRTIEDRIEGVVLTFVDVTDMRQAREEAAQRAAQQQAVAELGTMALRGESLPNLFQAACERAVSGLGLTFAKVLRHRPDTQDLIVERAVGWPSALLGVATVPDATHSQGGYTLLATEPVVVPDLETETRFNGPPLLTDYGIKSGISVPIWSGGSEPFGVLGVHDGQTRIFSDDDAQFVQAIANVLGNALKRRADEQTMREQLGEIETIYDSAPIGLAYLDTSLRYRRINDALADMNGLSVEDHIGQRPRDLLPELAETVEPLFRQIVETGNPVVDIKVEGTTPRDPDDLRTWLCSYVPDVGPEGDVLGISLVVRDVTERTRAEAELADALERLELAMDTSGLGAYDVDLIAGTTTYDTRAQALFLEPEVQAFEDAVGKAHPEDADALDAILEAACDPVGDDPTFRSVHRHIRPDGAILWVAARGRAVFEGDGDERRAVRIIGVVMDITDIRETQEQLRRQLAEVESYFDAVPVGIAVLDTGGHYARVNRVLEEMTGRRASELVSQRARDLWPVHAEANEPYVQRVMRTGLPVLNIEMSLPRPAEPEGELRDWLVSVYPLRGEDDIAGVSVVIQDVTVIRQAEKGLERQAAELEKRVTERTEQVRQLATDVTHAEQAERQRIAEILHDDLQQLLYAMQMKTQLLDRLADTSRDAEAHHELVAETDELIDRAIGVTRSLTADLSPPLLPDEGFERALAWGAHRLQEAHGLEVTVEGDTDVRMQLDVQVLLFRIVRELLFNVVKHAGVNEASVHVESQEGRVRVIVSDEGVGFDLEALTANESGIGLFGARERLGLIGGSLHVDSRPGTGTHVTVECPSYV
ncbi:MAG: hypothetical protein Rubg2KO_03120 [Rubricoccaceae bacterium]